MSCRSDEKIICPWCGEEMKRDWRQTIYGGPARKVWFKCENCRSISPIEWGENYDEALKTATEYDLRCYTPPQPMTLQKPMAKLEEALGKEIEIEIKGEDRLRKVSIPVHARMAKQFEIIVPRNIAHIDPVILPTEDYGKTWRCWERKPTDEERSAAGWEISPE